MKRFYFKTGERLPKTDGASSINIPKIRIKTIYKRILDMDGVQCIE